MASEVKLPYAGTAAESVKLIPMNPSDTYGIEVNRTLKGDDEIGQKDAARYETGDYSKLGVNVATGRSSKTKFSGGR